jgi:hypothetical protein
MGGGDVEEVEQVKQGTWVGLGGVGINVSDMGIDW